MAQPTLSRQIALLEEEFGMQFFNRDKSGLTLTPAGKIFYDEAKRAYEAERLLRVRLDAVSRGYKRNLKIAILEETIPNPRLIKAIRAFHREHPETDIEMRIADIHNLYLEMENGSIDIAVTVRNNVDMIKNVECIDLSNEEVSLAIASEYPLPEREYLTAADHSKIWNSSCSLRKLFPSKSSSNSNVPSSPTTKGALLSR
jgi:DNA-binding transcriptional LysR family regulator